MRGKDLFYAAELAGKIGDSDRQHIFTQRACMGTGDEYNLAGINLPHFKEARAAEKKKNYRLAGELYEQDGRFINAINAFCYEVTI